MSVFSGYANTVAYELSDGTKGVVAEDVFESTFKANAVRWMIDCYRTVHVGSEWEGDWSDGKWDDSEAMESWENECHGY